MQTQPITIKNLQEMEGDPKFSERTPAYFAGRCLLDALQFLRNDPKWPARSGQLVNAHAIRLCWICMNDLGGGRAKRIESSVRQTYERLRLGRNPDVPFYGPDFWEWSYILQAMVAVAGSLKDADLRADLADEVNEFYQRIVENLDHDLSLNKSGENEWFGPATPTAAHKLLRAAQLYIQDKAGLKACLRKLKSKALTPIDGDTYFGRVVRPDYHQWHLGQVVAEFGRQASAQRRALHNFTDIDGLSDVRDKAYALARVAQGALAVGDKQTSDLALRRLYDCEDLSRPLGSGIVGDHAKASLNALEGVWSSLKPAELKKVAKMVDALIAAHKRTNRIGILVALKTERDACIAQFERDRAKRTEANGVVELKHKDYEVVILTGKATIETPFVTGKLIKDLRVTRVLMVGIAGSLGEADDRGKVSPAKGDVVIATSTAGFLLRSTVGETAEPVPVPVPFGSSNWNILPTDVSLFAQAHDASLKMKSGLTIHEGLIVTVNGFKSHLKEKARILENHPGGLAIAEEGFPAALVSLAHSVPYLEIRGISDLAQGELRQQRVRRHERRDWNVAAANAAKVALALIKSLSKSWQ